ncbi:MAG: hypothetical protein QOC66_2218 [Pseudonocardiales bacterium]|jgi:pimeloyl-ACP methyl ester carboxylesterase|nr:hypothetical protein [Pseudonocardiales bacterium]
MRFVRALISVAAAAVTAISPPVAAAHAATDRRVVQFVLAGQEVCAEVTGAPATTPATHAQSPSRRPVIFVHGWTADGNALRCTGEVLTRQLNSRIVPFYFDYHQNATIWAGNSAVSGRLASYIKDVSAAYRRAGGDGKVLLVGHSMGGLAALYASSSAGADIGGVVTFDTPYLGSPFGNTSIAGSLQGLQQHGVNVPLPGDDAQVCLAPHENGAPLAGGCHYSLPPYLPANVPITQIGGSITVRRTFLGIHMYDLPFDSDGIVSLPSSQGYLEIGKRAARPHGQPIDTATDNCTITSDSVSNAVKAAGWTGNLLVGFAAGAGQFFADNSALDGLNSGHLTAGLIAYLGAITLAAPCSHTHVYTDQSALNQATEALNADLGRLAPSTAVINLAPVDKAGSPTSGWSVDNSQLTPGYAMSCQFGNMESIPAPDAVTGNIYSCGATADSADTCWPSSSPDSVLCLRDPWSHQLSALRIADQLTGSVAPRRDPQPIGLELSDGEHCRLRYGGAWDRPTQHPDWVGYYSCDKTEAIWGPPSRGIDKATKQWTVYAGNYDKAMTKLRVIRAYFVTTAP